ncbi:MAG: BlaI/MecI/CopY family transcriptional regulator [Verrucomicrobiales bacterium]|nr:BlaI/MecI/CopY family transcriptional regulator [Verrucomicrobiales bacterium]
MNSQLSSISPAEREVLTLLWSESPLATAIIVERLGTTRGWSRGTIRSLLSRLVKKGAAKVLSIDGRQHYKPLLRKEDSVRHESRTFLERVFSGASADMVIAMVEETRMTPEQIQRLRGILREKEK